MKPVAELHSPLVWVSSSAVGAPPIHRHFGMGNASRWSDTAWKKFAFDHGTHKMLVGSIDSSETAFPMLYCRFEAASTDASLLNSAASATAVNDVIYAEIEAQLETMRAAKDDAPFEEGAIDTALGVLHEIQKHDLIPPLVTAQGDDAVVMLWSIRNATYAITITDGELGYIVRQHRRQLKKQDSIKVEKFSLPALTSHGG
ncbi:hypothetical protein ACVWXO_000710 [Bradyrhizobium sp. LM2.7]